MKDSVIIATYTYSFEYTVLKTLLERANISYFFENETMLGVLPFHSQAIGGIKLRVHKEDAPKAKQIIEDLKNNPQLRIV